MELITTWLRCMGIICRGLPTMVAGSLRDTGLHESHIFCLLAVCQRPGESQEALSHLLLIDKSTMTRVASSLERAGFVERRRSETDRRSYGLYPKERAFELLPRLVDVLRECQSVALRDMSPEEGELLCDLVEHMARNVSRGPAVEEES